MRKSILFIYLLVGLFVLGAGCKRKAKLTPDELESLTSGYASLQASVDTAWKIMIDEDNQKLFYLKRLLQEVSYTNDYDSMKFALLMTKLEELKALRYDRNTMSDSDLIDKYDSLTIKLVPEIADFARSHPLYENYPLMGELIGNIDELDNNVLFKRSDYDREAKKFNEFISNNEEVLLDNLEGSDLNKKPLFEIPAE
jgi:hypothetical protein